ncbi:MAG: ABC transporter substrate-binding protein [Oscillibacter sp.]|jgi:iron complex transport system substrate-binding protein|nr:ABC transporter substrate-binding protein [Oscillibacter sp.]
MEETPVKRLCPLFVILLLLAACGGNPPEKVEPPPPSDKVVSFTDDLGRELAVEPPQRVAAMIGSFADVWCLAGGRDTLAAAAGDAWTSFDLELGEDVADLGAVKEPSLEVLLAAEPDLILASVNTAANLELEDTFAQAGIPAAYFEVDCFEDYLRMLEICTRLTGRPERYETCGESVRAQVDAAVARQDGSAPRVLYVRATGSSCKAKGSEGSVLGEMLADLGCVNIADGGGLLENLSLEGIIAGDPDYIFAVLQGADASAAWKSLEGALLSNPAWSGLRAVEEGRFITLDHRLYNLKPNARWGEAYEGLADILYPG